MNTRRKMHQLRGLSLLFAACWLAAVWLNGGRIQAAPAAQQRTAAPAAAQAQQAVFQRYCLSCHNQALKSRSAVPIAFDDLSLTNVGARAETWEKIIRKVRTGLMPPASAARPDKTTHDAFVQWLEREWDPLESTCRHASLSIL